MVLDPAGPCDVSCACIRKASFMPLGPVVQRAMLYDFNRRQT